MNKKIERVKRQVLKFNAELEEYAKATGGYELPIIDSTIIGYEELLPYEIVEEQEEALRILADGFTYEVRIEREEDFDGEIYEYVKGWDNGYDALKDGIAYDRRRLKKGWRIWRAENPDAELEKEDDE